jgi:2-oxoglutarate dehydrogenase E2 component (dihydrolipoamide succinyltransferase)
MADFQLVMPKMGESIMEATILKWHKKEGDHVEIDETILEIATDKVDSEIPSPVSGKITSILFDEDAVVPVGSTVALIQTSDVESDSMIPVTPQETYDAPAMVQSTFAARKGDQEDRGNGKEASAAMPFAKKFPPVSNGRFYSPLVRKIAQEEGLSLQQLDTVPGSGLHGRVTKRDILSFIEELRQPAPELPPLTHEAVVTPEARPAKDVSEEDVPRARSLAGSEEIVQMDRMRKLIAGHMVNSKRVSAHVTSFVEADVTDLVKWREHQKDAFFKLHGTRLTYTPVFIHAVVKAIVDFPMINISVRDDEIIIKRDINIGMATALPSGNLIVPVIKHADDYSLVGLAKKVNDLADRARNNELKPDEITGGTFTITNVGIFGNVMGTPIINQPQVAILATGAIKKKPAVVETEYGDLVAVRHMMFLSMSYDHRVVDGYLGGSFLRKVADYLEQFSHDDIS